MRAWRLGALLLPLLASGCVTFVWGTQGRPIEQDKVDALESGRTTLREVLRTFGAPHEVHNHADGRMLVYRHRARNTFRLGISASQALRFVDLAQVASEAAGNLSFTLWRIHSGEDRLVLLVDHADVVQGVGYRNTTAELPVF